MKCPDTPKSVISEMLNQNKGTVWQKSWNTFFEIYYSTMLSMAKNVFKNIGWLSVPNEDMEEIISESVISIVNAFKNGKYQNGKYRFRGFLKQIITRRIIDFIRRKNKKRLVPVEILDLYENAKKFDACEGSNPFERLEDDEADEYKKSVVMDAWENIRPSFSPQTCLIFEMSQLEGKNVPEISEILGVTRNIIDSCVHRVLKKLKSKLEEENYRRELAR